MNQRRALTLVEVMVAVVIGFMLLGVLYDMLSGSVRVFTKTQTHLGLESSAQIVLDIIQDSAAGMLVDVDEDTTLLSAHDGMAELSFYVSRADNNGPFYRGRKETFGLKPEPNGNYFYFVHNGKVHKDLTLEDLTFRVVQKPSLNGKPLCFVQIFVTAVNPVAVDSKERRYFSLVGLTALTSQTRMANNSHWNPNPYIYKKF